MTMKDFEHEKIDRAKSRIRDSGLSQMTIESATESLSMSADLLAGDSEPSNLDIAGAMVAQAIAITHMGAGLSTLVKASIANQVVECAKKGIDYASMSWGTVVKIAFVKSPWPICTAVCVLALADKLPDAVHYLGQMIAAIP